MVTAHYYYRYYYDPSALRQFVYSPRGRICYAGGGHHSRGTQLFFVKKPAPPYLGKEYWENPIAEIVQGVDILDEVFSYGDLPPKAVDQVKIYDRGAEYLNNYPKLDYFQKCEVVKKKDEH